MQDKNKIVSFAGMLKDRANAQGQIALAILLFLAVPTFTIFAISLWEDRSTSVELSSIPKKILDIEADEAERIRSTVPSLVKIRRNMDVIQNALEQYIHEASRDEILTKKEGERDYAFYGYASPVAFSSIADFEALFKKISQFPTSLKAGDKKHIIVLRYDSFVEDLQPTSTLSYQYVWAFTHDNINSMVREVRKLSLPHTLSDVEKGAIEPAFDALFADKLQISALLRIKEQLGGAPEPVAAAPQGITGAADISRYLWQININRFGTAAIVTIILGLMISVYKYNKRLSAFYMARADALELGHLIKENISDVSFARLSAALTPKLDFERGGHSAIEKRTART